MKRYMLGFSLLLAGVIAVQLLWPIGPPQSGYRPAGGEVDPARQGQDLGETTDPSDLPPMEHYDAMLQRPLFIATRRVPVIEAVPVTPKPRKAVGKPRFKLTAIIRSRQGTYALISTQKKGAKTQRLKLGQKWDGWRVKQITNDRLILASGGEQYVMQLRTYKPVLPGAGKSGKKSGAAKGKGAKGAGKKAGPARKPRGKPQAKAQESARAKAMREQFEKTSRNM